MQRLDALSDRTGPARRTVHRAVPRRPARAAAVALLATAAAVLASCQDTSTELTAPDPLAAARAATNAPAQVRDLAVASVTSSSVTLAWTEVDDGTGRPASYEVRFARPPLKWGSATPVTLGDCAAPVRGGAVGARRTCAVEGLDPVADHEFRLVAFRGTLNQDAVFGDLSNVARATTAAATTGLARECASPRAGWIWCDDFDEDRLARYFEYEDAAGAFARAAGVGVDGSPAMRARFAAGQVSAGSLHLAFGKTPQSHFRPVDAGTAVHRDVYWRVYVRNAPDWTGGGADKLSRAMSFASATSWAQAMIAHVWAGSAPDESHLVIDPASGTDPAGNLRSTGYNDWPNLRWLGAARSATPVFDAAHVGAWQCVEARARLNDPGEADGVFELWIDGALEARRTGLNWVGSFDAYGINAVFLENYWDEGSPKAQERYLDNFVVSTQPIGCGDAAAPPAPVAQVTVAPSTLEVEVGAVAQLAARLTDAAGNELSGRTVTWSSSDPGVAVVDGAGRVTAVAAGAATVKAGSEGVSGSAAVTVVAPAPAPVASVAISPARDTVPVGGTTQLTVTLRDAAGNVLTGRDVSWSSSDAGVATVSGSGVVSGVAAGAASIAAVSEGRSATASITVLTPPPPGRVTNLAAVSASDSSATLTFTQVDDGTGAPADYEIRYAPTPIGWGWGAAAPVTRGSCARPVQGTAVGAALTCTATGLTAGTSYDFQLVAFRGTLDTDAVFGELANVATVETAAAAAPAVASVQVSPASASVQVGATTQLSATLRDAAGDVLTDRSISWSSSDPLKASVDRSGLVTGLLGGTATITATSEGRTGSAAVTVSAPVVGDALRAHEPLGYLPITDQPWSALGSLGWKHLNRSAESVIVNDPSALLSGPAVLEHRYPAGFAGGGEPAVDWIAGVGGRRMYVSMRMMVSDPWTNHQSSVNKLSFLWLADAAGNWKGNFYLSFLPAAQAGRWHLRMAPERPGHDWSWVNQNVEDVTFALGEWVDVEMLIEHVAGERWRVRWWVDGVLAADDANVAHNDLSFDQFEIAPTWGGMGGSKPRAEYLRFDHVYLSH